MNARSRRRAAQLTGLVMIAGLAAGCGSGEDSGAESATDVSNEERTVEAGTGELPDSWPSSVPMPAHYEVVSTTSTGVDDEASHTAVLTVPHPFQAVLSEMKKVLAESEWSAASPEMDSTDDDVDSWQQLYSSEGQQLVVSLRAVDGGVSVALSTSPATD